jgi:hypothetical protein
LVCAIAACVGVAAPAGAQTERPMGGPFSGLFTGSPRDQPQTLDVRGSGFAAWDDNLLAQTPGSGGVTDPFAVDPRFLKPGVASGLQGSVAYQFRKNGTRSQFQLAADGGLQQFANGLGTGVFRFFSYGASTGLTTKVTNKTSVSLGAGAGYAPYFQYAPFLKNTTSEESPVGSDYGFAVDSEFVRSTSASASVENRFTKKSGVSAGVVWDQRIVPEHETANIDTRAAHVSFSHNLTRKFAFHLGYGIQESLYSFSSDLRRGRTHNLDIGLGYGDGLTLTFGRHYTLNMSIAATMAKNGDPRLVATTGKDTAFLVGGNASLSRSIGRNWGASIGYLRGTNYVVGFAEPVTMDSANAGISGTPTPRLNVSGGVGAARGQQVFSQSRGKLVTYTASTKVTYGLFSYLGLFAQASYYRFSIPPGFTSDFQFVPQLNRRSASVGLTTWVPLIKQRRARQDPAVQATGQP